MTKNFPTLLPSKFKSKLKIIKTKNGEQTRRIKPFERILVENYQVFEKRTKSHFHSDHFIDEQKAEILANTFKEIHNIDSTDSDEDQNIINSVSTFLQKHKNIHTDNTRHYQTNP